MSTPERAQDDDPAKLGGYGAAGTELDDVKRSPERDSPERAEPDPETDGEGAAGERPLDTG